MERRNCRGLYDTKFTYVLGDLVFSQCPLSSYIFDGDVMPVIDLILTSMDTGIPVVGTCLLDQTPAFFKFLNTIRSEQSICHKEIQKIRDEKAKKEASKNRSGRR